MRAAWEAVRDVGREIVAYPTPIGRPSCRSVCRAHWGADTWRRPCLPAASHRVVRRPRPHAWIASATFPTEPQPCRHRAYRGYVTQKKSWELQDGPALDVVLGAAARGAYSASYTLLRARVSHNCDRRLL